MANHSDISPFEEQLKSQLEDLEMAPSRDFFAEINAKVTSKEVSPPQTEPSFLKYGYSVLGIITLVGLLSIGLSSLHSSETVRDSNNSTPSQNETLAPQEVDHIQTESSGHEELNTPVEETPIIDENKSNVTLPLKSEESTDNLNEELEHSSINEVHSTETTSVEIIEETSDWQKYLDSNTDSTELLELFDN